MTLTLAWWALPVGLVLLGIVAIVVCEIWAMLSGGGMLAGFFEGLVGIAIFLVCLFMAGGIVIGRWLS